ncbi:MAG TPA: hypothetical protein VFL14_01600 [Xanthomonadales bacterium]|nr:hypothetical protein [Xanthomonadales bacterium]
MGRPWALLLLAAIAPAHARLPAQAPPLPPPGAGYTIVNVSTAQQLADACWNLASNRAIVVAPGTYDLATVVFPNGVDGRLTIGRFGAAPISNIQVRGATGNPADVVIRGAGMLNNVVPFGMQLFTATDVTIADLTLGNVYYHAVMEQGDQGAQRVRLYHVRLFDTGQQIVKGTTNADDVTIEYSELYYTTSAPNHPEGSPPGSCYTNAVDGFGVDRWIVRDSLMRNIRCQDGTLAGPAILLWAGASASLVERNTIVDSSRGIALGLTGPTDHAGGIARNNFIRWASSGSYAVDVPIYTTSPNAQLLHNTALASGRYPNAIEVRFAGATNVAVRGNLTDAAIAPRDGAVPVLAGNRTNAQAGWFVDPASGNLHLAAAGSSAVDQLTAATTDDFDGEPRSLAANAADQGADELGPADLLLRDGFE